MPLIKTVKELLGVEPEPVPPYLCGECRGDFTHVVEAGGLVSCPYCGSTEVTVRG